MPEKKKGVPQRDLVLEAQICAHYRNGLSLREIKQICGRSVWGIHNILTRNGVPLRDKGGPGRPKPHVST